MQETQRREDYLPPLQPTPEQVIPQSYFIITWTIVALNVLVYAAMCLKGLSPTNPDPGSVLPWGADFGPMTLDGQWWRILTSTFVHFGILHIGMNMYILYQLGPFTELLYGRIRFLLLYLLAGVGGSLVSLAIHPGTVSAGASGAIFGVYGALLAFLLVQRGIIPRERSKSIAQSAGVFLVYNLFFGLRDSTTDLSAHAGGFVIGFLAGCLLAKPETSGTRRLPVVRTVTAAVVGLVLCVGSLKALALHNHIGGGVFSKGFLGENVDLGDKGRVLYGGSMTRSDAQQLAKSLTEGPLGKNPDIDILVSKGRAGTDFYIPVGGSWNNPETVVGFTEVVRQSAGAIGGLPITVHLTDDAYQLRNTFVVQ